MALSQVLQSFFISLGFKIDAKEQQSFLRGVGDAKQAVIGLATATGFINLTSLGESLYWTGQRAQASVAGLQNIRHAASQLGVSADAAQGAVERLGQFIQSHPGGKQWLESWIGPFADVNEALEKIGVAFRDAPASLRLAFTNFLGIDYGLAQALFSPEMNREIREQEKRVAAIGVDQKKAIEAAAALALAYGDLKEEITLVGQKLYSELAPDLVEFLTSISSALPGFIGGLERLADTLLLDLKIMAAIWKGAFSFGEKLAATMDVPSRWGAALGEKLFPEGQAQGRNLRGKFDAWLDRFLGGGSTAAGLAEPAPGDAHGMIEYFQRKFGWKREHAIGIVANIMDESGGKPNVVGDSGKALGLGQWHPDRQALFQQVMGRPMLGSSMEEQLWFYNWELRNSPRERKPYQNLLSTTNPADAAEAVVGFERPKYTEKEIRERRLLAEQYDRSAPHIEQTNNITINSGGDPAAIGDSVGRGIDRANENLLRNVRPNVR